MTNDIVMYINDGVVGEITDFKVVFTKIMCEISNMKGCKTMMAVIAFESLLPKHQIRHL